MPINEFVEVELNGKKVSFKAPATVLDAIQYLKPESNYVAAELNGVILDKDDHTKTILKNKDVLEIIQPLGGGSRL